MPFYTNMMKPNRFFHTLKFLHFCNIPNQPDWHVHKPPAEDSFCDEHAIVEDYSQRMGYINNRD
jgi:hypothetical protein